MDAHDEHKGGLIDISIIEESNQKAPHNGVDAPEFLTVQLPADWKISEDDPVVVFEWFSTQVGVFIANLPLMAGGQHRPGWVQVNALGAIDSPEAFQRMVVDEFAGFGGGSSGFVAIGPNNQAQFANIMFAISSFQTSGWVQAVAVANNVQSPLCRIYYITSTGDRSRALPVNLHAPPNGMIQLFQ
mmetsp:Transcript_38144/g.59489  ORF Transcript_38144/g.59489 Transcript_38144/m.59489 type:complete len:186 (-) Transcript_38144:2671-3228(-)